MEKTDAIRGMDGNNPKAFGGCVFDFVRSLISHLELIHIAIEILQLGVAAQREGAEAGREGYEGLSAHHTRAVHPQRHGPPLIGVVRSERHVMPHIGVHLGNHKISKSEIRER
jgi:hypothetical protein